ncbi:radical SAM protein [bacterium]|nr:radical SAM protein [bacterium]
MSEIGDDSSRERAKLRYKGLLEGRPLTGPETVHVDIANGCNTNCVTCWDHSPFLTNPRDLAWKKEKKVLEDFKRLVDDAAELGAEALIISGQGEPFVNPDAYAMLEHAKSRGLHVTFISNVLLLDPDRVVALGLDDLLASVNGSDERSYLEFHPNLGPRDWNVVREKLARLRDLGLRAKHVQVVDRANLDLPRMVELAHELGAKRLNWKLASTALGTEAVSVTREDRARIRDELLPRASALADELELETNAGAFLDQVRSEDEGTRTAPIEENGCFMGFFYARVLVDGTVLYCCNTNVVVGKLDERTRFRDLWTGSAWQCLRERLRRGEYLSGCERCGKWVENRKIAKKLDARVGRERRLALIGRGSLP